jgi:hypothetical protein
MIIYYYLNRIKQLNFVMLKRCVLFEVQTGFLNIIQTSLGFKGCCTVLFINKATAHMLGKT